MMRLRRMSVPALLGAFLAMVRLDTETALAFPAPQGPTQTKSKSKPKAKETATDTIEQGSALGPGTWTGLIKDSPPSDIQMIMAYHPQLTQGLPVPGLNQPAPKAKNAKAAAAAQARQRNEALQKLKDGWKSFRFDLTESVPLRFLVLPDPFDDKGEILKPTPEQLDQLKKGGIPGRVNQLRPGMVVRVHQVQDGTRMIVDKVDVLREVELNLPGLNDRKAAPKAQPKKKG
jgi:hypothetical protein